MSCKIISSAFSADCTGTGGVSHADCLDGNRKQITVDRFGTLDSAVSVAGLGDLGALDILSVAGFVDYRIITCAQRTKLGKITDSVMYYWKRIFKKRNKKKAKINKSKHEMERIKSKVSQVEENTT
ncbi:hypothetical protein Tco_0166989 [Tanacetum coccineum]